jgi:hypothetical protein
MVWCRYSSCARSSSGGGGRASSRHGVRGDQLDPLGEVARHERLEGLVEGVDGQPLGLQLVEHPKMRVDAGGKSVRSQDPGAETVDRGDEGAFGGAGLLPAPQLQESGADPRPHLRRGLLGERDREDRLHRLAVVDHRAHESLHEHGRLARARAGANDERAVPPVRGPPLLGGELSHRSLRQIDG